jgi:hypothetical protein
MRNTIIICLCLLSLASCNKKEEFDPAFIVITKEAVNVNSSFCTPKGSIVSMERVNFQEIGFVWYSLTPPVAPNPVIYNKEVLPYTEVFGDFSANISLYPPDSIHVQAYAITVDGELVKGRPVKVDNTAK